jgi:hypothetical protein
VEVFRTAVALIVRSMVLSAQSAGQQRLLFLQRAVAAGEEVGELVRLRDENRRLTSELRLPKDRFGEAPARKRYTPMQRLRVLWHMAYFGTERVILTLKYEWLKRVPIIRGLDHLSQLLHDFGVYYNEHRGHATLDGAVPQAIYRGEQWNKPQKSAKAVPATIERRFFPDAQITAYRLAA